MLGHAVRTFFGFLQAKVHAVAIDLCKVVPAYKQAIQSILNVVLLNELPDSGTTTTILFSQFLQINT